MVDQQIMVDVFFYKGEGICLLNPLTHPTPHLLSENIEDVKRQHLQNSSKIGRMFTMLQT